MTTTTTLSCPQTWENMRWWFDIHTKPCWVLRYINKCYCQSNNLNMPTQGSLCEGPNVQTSNLISIAREWPHTQVRYSYYIQIIDFVWFLFMDVLWLQHLSSPPLQLSPPQGTSSWAFSKSVTIVYSRHAGALKMQTREMGSVLKWEAWGGCGGAIVNKGKRSMATK